MYHPHSIKVASWWWAALKCITAWQRLRCAWVSRCAWIVATDHGWSVAKLSRALPCLKHDKCGCTGVCMCVSKHCTDSEVCQAKHAECHQISVLLLPRVHGEIRESSDLNMTHLNMNRCTRTYFWPTSYPTQQKKKDLLLGHLQLSVSISIIFPSHNIVLYIQLQLLLCVCEFVCDMFMSGFLISVISEHFRWEL